MKINRNLAIGMYLNGIMSHFLMGERIGDRNIQHIDNKIKSKLKFLRQGTPKEYQTVIAIAKKKKKKPKDIELLVKADRKENEYVIHSRIADKAWNTVAKKMTIEITITDTVMSILRKEPQVQNYFMIDSDVLNDFVNSSDHKGEYIFRSSKTATALIEFLDKEIANFNYNIAKVA